MYKRQQIDFPVCLTYTCIDYFVCRESGLNGCADFSASLAVSTMPARNLPPCARWSLLFLASPACIFLSISPPAWPSRCCRRGFCLLLHAGLHLSSHHPVSYTHLTLPDDSLRVDLGGRRIIKKKFFSSRRRHTRSCLVSWARRCV